jgi:enamine deaminase RidA (YjgF/YER057c/UK114 family)
VIECFHEISVGIFLLTIIPSGAVLEAGGSSLAKAVKVNVFLANMDDFAAVNEVYAKFFPDPKPVSIFFRLRLSICGC